MVELRDRVAVVTGAASGIGRAIAARLGGEGMRVVLADIEPEALQQTAQELEKDGVEALAVVTDVSRAESVQALAERTLEHFGAVHVVCNNAGVFTGGLSWEGPIEDWEWVLGVNLWGVVHGIRTFVPILLEQDVEGHVVNTASMAGVTSMPFSGIYVLSKHAVLALSETLHHELTQRGSKIGVSALCPEIVSTNIGEAERNRPEAMRPKAVWDSPEREVVRAALRAQLPVGAPPERMAERVLRGIRENRFYLLAEEGDPWRSACETRLEDIRLGRNPTFVPPVAED